MKKVLTQFFSRAAPLQNRNFKNLISETPIGDFLEKIMSICFTVLKKSCNKNTNGRKVLKYYIDTSWVPVLFQLHLNQQYNITTLYSLYYVCAIISVSV